MKMRIGLTLMLLAALLCGVALAEASGSADAGEGVSVADYVLSSEPENAAEPVTELPERAEAEHSKVFSYPGDVALKGVFGKNSFFFNLPSYWETRYAYAQIEFAVSPLIEDVPASLTFFINDHPIDSCAVDYRYGASQVTYVSIPVSMLKEGYNEFALTGYVRLYDDDGCLDDFSGANWISISGSSLLELGYDIADAGLRVCDYPYPLLSTLDETGEQLAVYVPESASVEELAAAFLLRADLGNGTSGEDEIDFKTLAHFDADGKNALVVAEWDRLPDAVRNQLPPGSTAVGGALVYEYETDDRFVLVVTARDAADLAEGAAMLMDGDRASQEKGTWAFVASGASAQMTANRRTDDVTDDWENLGEITAMDGIEFIGPFRQESIVYLPVSGDFVLGEGGKADLKLRYSDNLDFDRSMVTVYWGDTPVASKKLDRDRADEDSFSFMMPSDVVGTHAASLKIAFDLEIEDLYCTHRADEMPWAYVRGDSTLYLPVGRASSYDLSLRPYPFQQMGRFNDLALVVPDAMTDVEYALFGRLAALLGANVEPYGTLSVWFASEYPAEAQDSHVAILGTWDDNALLRAINDHLSFSYEDGGARFADNAQLLMGRDYAESVGVLQIIRSPWQEGRAILAVCGVDQAALENIGHFIAVQENTWALEGDAFLIDPDLDTKSYRFLGDEAVPQATLRERVEENRDVALLTLVSTAAMLLMLIAIVLILLRYRKNRREEEKK